MDTETPDTTFMTRALALAGRLPARTWPNPPVGAVVVRDGAVVGRGAHLGPGSPHAERVALRQAGAAARGARLYVTLEPCNHRGRTGPCVPAIIEAGVAEVVMGVRDPNPNVPGGGREALEAAGIEVRPGPLGPECLDLIRPFAVTHGFARPFLCLKTAASRDGFAAPAADARPDRAPVYLLGDEALEQVHVLRRWHDLILVGSGTVAADRPVLDGRRVAPDASCPTADPAPGCITRRPDACADWRRDPHLVFTTEAAATGRGADRILCRGVDGGVDPADLLERAFEHGFHTVLLEGGPRVAGAFLEAGLVDQWIQYVSPKRLGDGVPWPEIDPASAGLVRTGRLRVGADTKIVWDRPEFAAMRNAALSEAEEVR